MGKEAATNDSVNKNGCLGNKVTIILCRKKMIPGSYYQWGSYLLC
jgi:hypothetical protein